MADERLLVLGGTGQIATHVLELALERGMRVTALSRNPPEVPSRAVDYLNGDRHDPAFLRTALAGKCFDFVFDHCAYRSQDVSSALSVLAGRIGTYVLLSSVAVYPAGFDWEESQAPPLSEYPTGEQVYSRAKREAETSALKLGATARVVRLPFVIGWSSRSTNFGREIRRLGTERVAVVESPSARLSVIHALDAARCLFHVAASDAARVWNACADGVMTVESFLLALAEVCSIRGLRLATSQGAPSEGFAVHTRWEVEPRLSHYSIGGDWTLCNRRARASGFEFSKLEESLSLLAKRGA